MQENLNTASKQVSLSHWGLFLQSSVFITKINEYYCMNRGRNIRQEISGKEFTYKPLQNIDEGV